MKIPAQYQGREQSFIKHTLLNHYLTRLFMIIGKRENTIRYIDCFAGPWQEGSNDLNDTSIAISLNIMKKCHEGLKQRGLKVFFKALYIEKDKDSYNKLESFLQKKSTKDVSAESKHGDFYSLRSDILRWCGKNDFAFFFIDPKGWKNVVEINTLKPLIERSRSEFLINFMFDFILRAHSQRDFEEHMIQIFGEVPDTEGMTPQEKEIYLLTLYRNRLKKAQTKSPIPRSAYVKILDRYKDRTKYDLIYLTRHPLGIKVFMEESEKIDFIQKNVRSQVKQNHRIAESRQMEFDFVDFDSKNDESNLDEIKEYWLNKLSFEPKKFGIEELADMLEETGWFISDLQKAFKELIKEGKVVNCNTKRIRPKHVIHFNKNEYLKKLK